MRPLSPARAILIVLFLQPATWAKDLVPVTEQDFGLKIVQFDVGQADAAALITRDGRCCLIDLGRTNAHGEMIADFLLDQSKNGIKRFSSVDLLFASHYDRDHIGGAQKLAEHLTVKAAYDQGPSRSRSIIGEKGGASFYGKYVRFVGDPNSNGTQDPDESDFVRHRAEYGDSHSLGNVSLMVVSVRGDTRGDEFDIDLDPSLDGRESFDENPGSMMLLVRLGEFEFLTGGDATCADWVGKPDTENNVVRAGAIPGGPDIDVLKVSHHGSDTSSGIDFITMTSPEVGIISSTVVKPDFIPKKPSLMMLERVATLLLVTGAATDRGNYIQSRSHADDNYVPNPDVIHDNQGNVTMLVSSDGLRYTVRTSPSKGEGGQWTFSAIDSENVHPVPPTDGRFALLKGAETANTIANTRRIAATDPSPPIHEPERVDLHMPERISVDINSPFNKPAPPRHDNWLPTGDISWIGPIGNSLVWPIVALIISVLFKNELARLPERIAHIKFKDFEVKFFEAQVERLKSRLPQAVLHAAALHAATPPLVERSPRDAIIEAVRSLDEAAVEAIGRAKEGLNESQRNALLDLRYLADMVKSLPNLPVTKDQALVIVRAASALESELKSA